MTKKLLLTAIVILTLCLSVTTLARGTVSISDSLDTLEYNGTKYSRFQSSGLYTDVYNEMSASISLTASQQETIRDVVLYTSDSENIIEAIVSFNDGSVLSIKFLQDSYLEEYKDMLNKATGRAYIDFQWPEGNTVEVDLSTFGESSSSLSKAELYSDYFYVFTDSNDGSITILNGLLFIVDDSYYYVDYKSLGVSNVYSFDPYDYNSLSAYKIEDPALIEKIKLAEEEYYSDGVNFLLDDRITERLSKIFFVIFLGILPCVIAVIFLVLLRRAKGVYKKLYVSVCATALATSVLFTVLFAIIMHYN